MGGESIKNKRANVYIKSKTQQYFFFLPGMAWIVPKSLKLKKKKTFTIHINLEARKSSFFFWKNLSSL